MREFLRTQYRAVREAPAERLLRPGIKAAVIVAVLTVAAQWASEKSYDRSGLARLAGSPAPAAKPAPVRRP